jgi:hypothetical protein
MCCSFPPPRALLSFLTWGLFVSQNRTALTTWISPRTLLPSFGHRKSVLFYLALKTGEVQVGVQGTALREYFRIFWEIVWYCIVVLLLSFLVAGFLSSLVLLLLSQWWTPPLRLQDSACRTFLMMCDVPSMAVFCKESIECCPGIVSRYYYYYYYYYYDLKPGDRGSRSWMSRSYASSPPKRLHGV